MDNPDLGSAWWQGGYSPYAEPQQPTFVPWVIGPVTLVTPPSGLLVSLADARMYCRVDADDTSEDGLFTLYIQAATEFCQKEIPGHRQFLQATYSLQAPCWWAGGFRLPQPPLLGVDNVVYTDQNAVAQTLDATLYIVRAYQRAPGLIERAPGATWPAYQSDNPWPVTIQFRAGYALAQIPPEAKMAVLFLVSQWYTNRAPCGSATEEMANTVHALLAGLNWGSYS